MKGDRRQRAKKTVVPPHDPVDLAHAIESAASRPTHAPPFDPNAYARIVDDTIAAATTTHRLPPVTARDTPTTMEAAQIIIEATSEVETLARAMYASYLESSFPEALVLAEHVVERQPDNALAHAVVSRCKAVLGDSKPAVRLDPSSVVRLRAGASAEQLDIDRRSLVVLAHVDGVIDAATVAHLAGMSRVETLEHLHALLDEGILEVVA